jgi:hypothetical protein
MHRPRVDPLLMSAPDHGGGEVGSGGKGTWAIVPVLIALALVLGSCTSSGSGDVSASPDPEPTQPTGTSPASDEAAHPFVQDLWIYDRIETVNGSGAVVDHTEQILAQLQRSAGEAEPLSLIPGMTFTPVPAVAAHVKDPDGELRSDVTAVVGIIENDIGATFAVLGSVDADGSGQIALDDRVFIDTSFLGDAIEVGDLMSADFTLVQLLPTGDAEEVQLSALDLFAHRASREAIEYSADANGDVVVFADELGRIVTGSEGPLIPTKAQPMMSGFGKGIKGCLKSPGVKCVAGYLKEFGKGSTDSLKQLDRQLPIPPPGQQPPGRQPGPSVRDPLPCQNGCGKVTGDPHLATFDGHRYGMQGVGEFVLARHEADDLEIQIRTVPVNGLGYVSSSEVVAIGVGGQRVEVSAEQVLLDGEPVGHDHLAQTIEAPGFTIHHRIQTTSVETETGHLVTVERRGPSLIDVVVSPAPDRGGWTGLLGDADGDATNDLVAADGRQFPADLTFDDLYQDLVMGWRVTDEGSLFRYAAGESTATHTDLDLPDQRFTVDDLDAGQRRAAEAACRLGGVEAEPVLGECTLDYALTGDLAYLLSAQVNDAIDGILSGRLGPDGSALASAGDEAAPASPSDSSLRAWYVSGDGVLRDGLDTAVHVCPPLGSGGMLISLWGDGPYAGGSAVCRAALHAGVITREEGGAVRVDRQPGQDTYPSTTANGITSKERNRASSSFSVESDR